MLIKMFARTDKSLKEDEFDIQVQSQNDHIKREHNDRVFAALDALQAEYPNFNPFPEGHPEFFKFRPNAEQAAALAAYNERYEALMAQIRK